MAYAPRLHWLLFAGYCMTLFALPLGLLLGLSGAALGGGLGLILLGLLRYRGTERIAARLKAEPMSAAELPRLATTTAELCRRLGLPGLKLARLETPAINLAVFGFTAKTTVLLVTRGALEKLSREELAALVGRELVRFRSGELPNQAWLSQFLALRDGVVGEWHPARRSEHRSFYSFKLFLRQISLYPLSLVPLWLLKGSRNPGEVDLKSVKITRNPRALSEAMRRMDAARDRVGFFAPFSCRHLFLLPPPTQDPLARLFFEEASLGLRIGDVEGLTHAVQLT